MSRSGGLCVIAILLATLCLNARAQDEAPTPPPPASKKTAKPEPLLPPSIMVPLRTVRDAFPDLVRQLSTGADSAALDKPRITRAVVYASSDGAKQLTFTVDEYEYESQALLAYQQASQKTQLPDFEPIAIANVGQQVFAGAIKQGAQMQIVVVTLNGTVLVGATLAGYDDTTDNISKLVELARQQESDSHPHVSAFRKR